MAFMMKGNRLYDKAAFGVAVTVGARYTQGRVKGARWKPSKHAKGKPPPKPKPKPKHL